MCQALGVNEEAGRGGLLGGLEGRSTRITPLSSVAGKNRGKGIAIRSTAQVSVTSVQLWGETGEVEWLKRQRPLRESGADEYGLVKLTSFGQTPAESSATSSMLSELQ